jgi:hypothetical protein
MVQQAPEAAPDSIAFNAFEGLKNLVTRERLKPSELEFAKNIDLDDVGQAHRRRGYKKVATGDFHSLYTADDERVYGVKDGQLGIILPNYSFQAIHAVSVPPPEAGRVALSYAQIGDRIYYSCATDSGVIDASTDTWAPWGDPKDIFLSPVVNPTATLGQVRGRLLGKPPLATAIAYWNGRIYMAEGRALWATELYLYNYVDKTKNYLLFEDDITGIGVVTDGIYVGTAGGLWFLSGVFSAMKRERVMDSPVIPGSMIQMPSELANPPQIPGSQDTPARVSVLFMTDAGFCTGQDGGTTFNLSETKFEFPDAQRVAALYRRQDGVNQYIAVAENGGSPANNTRIGDYVDAEIIKADSRREVGSVGYFGDTLVADIV